MKIGISINLYHLEDRKEAIYRLLTAIEEMLNKAKFYLWTDFKDMKIKENKENKIITFEVEGKRVETDIIIQINAIYEK